MKYIICWKNYYIGNLFLYINTGNILIIPKKYYLNLSACISAFLIFVLIIMFSLTGFSLFIFGVNIYGNFQEQIIDTDLNFLEYLSYPWEKRVIL